MKDAMNYFIPIVEDPMNDITGRCITVNNHISSNGYYGYQPVATAKQETNMHSMDMDTNDIQFNNFIEPEIEEAPQMQHTNNNINRKRTWQECGAELQQYKKRRETDPLPMLIPQEQQPTNKCSQVRQPTHNIPDMSRCMMGHYI